MAVPALFGSEFRINTTIAGNQDSSSVAALANGKFVAVWEDTSSGSDDIKGQIYNADGSRFGGEMTIAGGASNQQRPVVTATADGRFAVAWEDHVGAQPNIMARVYNSDGTSPAGGYHDAFRVAPGAPGEFFDKLPQTAPAIGAAAGGRFLVSWSLLNGGDDDLFARAYNAAVAFSAEAIAVDSSTPANENQSAVAGLVNGNYIVVWTDSGNPGETDGFGSHIRARIYAGNGSTILGEEDFLVNATAFNDQSEPSVAGLSDGNFVVVWTHAVGSGADLDIRFRLFKADGTPTNLSADFGIAVQPEKETQASVVATATGFLVAWTDAGSADGSGSHIRAQLFNNNGSAASDPFIVNTTVTAGSQSAPTVASLPDGRFVITWTDPGQDPAEADSSGSSVRSQIFDPRTAAVNLTGTTFGDDWVGTAFGDTMIGQAGNDTLAGADGNDTLGGGDGVDRILGGAGDDKEFGNGGADFLSGGKGKDLLTGGPGADAFVFDAKLKKANVDHSTDFLPGTDEIRLDIDIFTKLKLGDLKKKAFFAKKNADEAKDGKDRIVVDTKSGECWYDKDGKGGAKAKLFAILDTGAKDISHDDFVVVA